MKVIFAIILLAAVANAALIETAVEKTFVAEPLYFQYNDTIREFSTEITNSGSLPYVAQVRADVIDESDIIFTAWSERKTMLPGNNGFFALHWFPKEGNYTTRYRVYYGGELNETTRSIIVSDVRAAENAFNITLVDVLDKFLVLNVRSSVDVEKAAIIPDGYPQGTWIAQKTISLKAGQTRKVILPYSSPVKNQEITIIVASEDGKYASSEKIKLEESKTLKEKILRLFFAALA